MSSNAGDQHLQIRDFSDREILAIVRDAGGVVLASELARRIFQPADGDLPHFTRCVTSRLVWMRRYGLIDREENGPGWQISAAGERLRAGTLTRTLADGIGNLAEDNSLALANQVGMKLVDAPEIAGRAMQRELTHQINRRRARLRGW